MKWSILFQTLFPQLVRLELHAVILLLNLIHLKLVHQNEVEMFLRFSRASTRNPGEYNEAVSHDCASSVGQE